MRQLYAQTSMRLVTQNLRGLTPEKLEMIIHTMKDRGIHAAALQETWAAVPPRRGNVEIDGFLLIWHGRGPRVILAIGMDGSASIGVGKWADMCTPERRPGRPVEPRGLRHRNDAGRELLAHMSVQSLCSAASFFRGRRRAPWVHPRAGQPCGLGHWLVRRSGLGRVTGACVRPSLAMAVDHALVYMAISTGRMRRRRCPRRVGARPANIAALRCSDTRLSANAHANTVSTSPQHKKIINKQNFEGTSLSVIALQHKAARACFWREAPPFFPRSHSHR